MSESVLSQILVTLADLKASQQLLSDKVDKMQVDAVLSKDDHLLGKASHYHNCAVHSDSDGDTVVSPPYEAEPALHPGIYTDKPVLTTYAGQKGVKPTKLNWGEADPKARGPIVVSHLANQINVRNAVGAYGGPYSIYRSLAVAMGDLPADHKPNFESTQPPIKIQQQPQWADASKIAEIKSGEMRVDGRVIVNETGELNVHKAAVDPVWFLPGVASRLKVEEDHLRRSLFENTGGMYPELITRPDLKVFLPPIGGLTVYIFGNHELLSDPNTRLTVRVHDECNGSDVFGSDICTCRPYLVYGMKESIKEAQNGGVGLIVYFRKEGRALGEVTKYLVYNARKREGDSASKYFQRTQDVAGVKDMRFQALMPDVFHWLGVTKIDRFMSMSNMKHDALIEAGIKILERVPIPDELIPPDSKVEMDAKIAAGYFTTGAVPREEDLCRTLGRGWDDFHM
ncbi:hypothetical protein BGX21_010096 [Mortierella sp. AD011]|nr:hypothetical protein BGX21_010096 [Mortierella sp. AD011]